ncbi:ABC transporter substrate-binding protein [Frankia sp. CNm7]|uniref:ABC transporter substrate-binding protein n=1 Tax=Frankia nepalensis TaxID=1836974 RepID=A0A937URL5_9ACTN|nr:ABC transporter substrate-binding protein [Frankia nepalensis]MBL7500525.1 ABC transporter substrate-binding protein [Frankia nepalensis]MBL7509781.1 ABC transporter substrate-binding protein [Frankia nepalensis]MBL7521234.1 ABC transporter substrate-binding protein [Frankia nepalensis]MBL7627901.1 ABC transporter substrate-binding protein [Frankia nepalensis]
MNPVRMATRLRRSPRAGIALIAATTLAALTACGGADSPAADAGTDSSSDQPITISFLSYNYGTPDIGGQGTQALIDAFEKAHPNITIKPQGVAVADVLTRLQTDTAAGSPPDVAQIGWSKMAAAYELLPIVPVQDIPPAADWDAAMEGFSENLLSAVAVDGKVKAVPYTISIPVIFYNADLFRQAGLDPAKPPTTIAEVKAAALAVTDKTDAEGVYLAVADPGKSDYMTQSVIASNGGREVGADGMPAFDQPAAVSALATVADLTSSGAQPAIAATNAVAAFSAGKLSMLIGSTAIAASLQKAADGKFELATTGFPSFGDKPAAPTYSGAGLAVLAKDPARQQAAWEFIKFLTSAEGFTIITSQIGYLPLRPALATDPKYLAPYFASNDLLSPALAQLDDVSPYQSFTGKNASKAVVTLQDEAIEPIVLRGADPAATLSAVAGDIRGFLAQK